MANIKIMNNVYSISSTLTPDVIAKVKKHRPDALALYTGTGNDRHMTFLVDFMPGVPGSVSNVGIVFDAASHTTAGVCYTETIPADVNDVKDYVTEKVGIAILNLNKVETQVAAAMESISAEVAEIAASIVMENSTEGDTVAVADDAE